jgi:histone H3/H4
MILSFADIGAGALRAALPLAIWGIGAAAYAAAKRDGRVLVSARWSERRGRQKSEMLALPRAPAGPR